jgi:hypothetical protein
MQLQDKEGLIRVTGFVTVQRFDKNGKLVQTVKGKNLVTTVGKAEIAKAINGDSVTLPSHMAIGTSSTAAAVGDTALVGTELARVAFTSHIRTNNAIAFVGTFGAGVGTGTVEEAGIFNDATTGVMLARFLTGTIVKGASDSIIITWTLTIG